jgi:hypothetical protein
MLTTGTSWAQPDVNAPQTGNDKTMSTGFAAMPGGLNVAAASLPSAGTFTVRGMTGYGRRAGLLDAAHVLNRFSGGIALSYAPINGLIVGFATDGRIDKHSGTVKEQGWVGDPRLYIRGGKAFGSVTIGGQLSLLIPGKDAPSFVFAATTVEARALASFAAGPATISVNGGFRLDRTFKSLVDNAGNRIDQTSYVQEDQISLGISHYNAGVVGAHAFIPFGKAYVGVEGSANFFTGKNETFVIDEAMGTFGTKAKPGPTLRGGITGGVAIADRISAFAYVEGSKIGKISEQARTSNRIPLVPYETTFTVGLGISASFGGIAKNVKQFNVVENKRCKNPDNPDPKNPDDADCPPKVQKKASIAGLIRDDAGQPVVGAKISVKVGDKIGTAVSDAKGEFNIGELPLGDSEVSVEVDGKKPAKAGLVLAEGANKVPDFTLEAILPPGELRGLVRSQTSSKPLAAKITVAATATTPAVTVSTEADGTFAVPLPPGSYTATVTSDGMAEQKLEVVIEANGVVIKNVDLRKK